MACANDAKKGPQHTNKNIVHKRAMVERTNTPLSGFKSLIVISLIVLSAVFVQTE